MGTLSGPRGRGPSSRAGRVVYDFMMRQNLTAVNSMTRATGRLCTYHGHNGSSTIDYIMVPVFLSDCVWSVHTGGYESLNTSDHYPISATLRIGNLPRSVRIEKGAERIKWDKLTEEELFQGYQVPICLALHTLNQEIQVSDGSPAQIDDFFDTLTRILHSKAKPIPRAKFRSHLKPYWSAELNDLKKRKMEWFKKWKDQGRSLDDNDPTRIPMKLSKKTFSKRLRAISKQYENEAISEAARLSEIDHDNFWRLFRRNNGTGCSTTNAIKNSQGKAVYEIQDILEVWRNHFYNLSTPKVSEKFDNIHFRDVSERVRIWCEGDDTSEFLEEEFSFEEVSTAISKLNLKKAPGYDGVTSEHLRYAGISILKPLCDLFNLCVRMEYVPSNFRRGIQVPLYKGKNTCSLDPDNYRGITLLTTYNKLFEVLIWEGSKGCWFGERVISDLQGAVRAGSSCIHTALTLQETIAKEREVNRNVFVAYYDVSKAFDSVWIDGLFHQLRIMGIRGSLWRILYKSYMNFNCCVRIGSAMSEWYPMLCGIHQGGYLSLVKYTAFINSLISSLETSGLCSTIYRVPTSPVGYADDVAACTTSKRRMDRMMGIVDSHGKKWRYSFNAKKSAVLVFGETNRERMVGQGNRNFTLGRDRVHERLYYDHVGIKTCVLGDTHVRTEEKV